MGSQQNIEARLCAFVEGELDGPERAEIEQFLAQNPQQRQLVNELIQARAILRDLPGVSPPPEIAEAFARHLERAALLGDPGPQERYRLSVNRWRRIRAVAAILILAGGLAALVAIVLPHSGPRTFSSSTPGLAGSGQQTPGGTQLATEAPANSPAPLQSGAGPIPEQKKAPPGPVADAQLDRAKTIDWVLDSTGGAKDQGGGLTSDATRALALSDGEPGTLRAVRDVALAADAVHTTMRQRSQQPSNGGAIYVVLRGSDAAAQVRRVQSQLEAASIAWTDVPATNLGYTNSATAFANVAPATQAAVLMNDRMESASAKQLIMTGRPASQPAASEWNQEKPTVQANGAANTPANANNNFANNPAATYSMNELPKQTPTQAPANPPTTIIWAHDVQRRSAQQVASELSELASPGVVGADVIPALMPVDTAAAGKAPSTGPAVSSAQSTTQSASELLAVGQSVTLIARDPMVNNSEVYHETQQIDTEGNVTVPAVGRVRAAGLAASDLQQNINRAYGTGQQAANVDWQVLTQTPAPMSAPTSAMMPTPPAAAQGGAIAGGPTTQTAEPATMPVATTAPATEPSAAGQAAVDLVIVIRQSGQAPGNNPPSSQPVSTANPQPTGETESGTPASPMPASMPAPAAPQSEQPALPPSPAATEPSDVGPAASQPSAEPSSAPPATGPTN